jgi:DNA-binding response OmpR family regulator
MFLRMAGFEVEVVQDGAKALERLSSSDLPEAVTLDLHLPRVSGNEIYTMMERRGESHRVLVVSADVGEVQNYLLRGANAVTKPVPMDDLTRKVREISEHSLVLGIA